MHLSLKCTPENLSRHHCKRRHCFAVFFGFKRTLWYSDKDIYGFRLQVRLEAKPADSSTSRAMYINLDYMPHEA